MASRAAQRSALMSIRPQFSTAILNGSKTIESRKRVLAQGLRRVVMYTTSPVQVVEGEFTVGGAPGQS